MKCSETHLQNASNYHQVQMTLHALMLFSLYNHHT